MANYYSIQEVMEKLGKTEQEVQGLVKEGQLRQYLDSGKPVFKVEDVDSLTEEIVGLDITSSGLTIDEGTELDLQLEATGEIKLEPDESSGVPVKKEEPVEEVELESVSLESEGGFGLSQMGDLSMADTNVGTVGINILSGTDDAYKLTEDTKAETKADEISLEEVPAQEAPAEEIESLDADSNLESFGSGSGLLDLSLQADDTSLGAVLDDILPAGAEAGADAGEMPAEQGIGLMDEEENLAEAEAAPMSAGLTPEPMAPMMAGGPAVPMVAVMPVDPRTNVFGVAMFLPMAAVILASIVMVAAIQGVMPSVLQTLIKTKVAGIGLTWCVVGGLVILMLLILMFAAMLGREKSAAPAAVKVKKEKAPKKEAPKKKRK